MPWHLRARNGLRQRAERLVRCHGREAGSEVNLLHYVIRMRHWPSKAQRDFMSSSPRRRARVRALADRIIAEMENEE